MNLQVKPTTALYIHMHSLHGLPILDHSPDIGVSLSYIIPSFISRPPSIVMGVTKVQTLLLPQLIFLFLICMSSSFLVQSRPLPPNFFHLDGMRNAGGRPSGDGHGFDTLDGTKEAGPSPKGPGHKYVVAGDLGGIKDAGPSPRGGGHTYVNGVSIGGIKNAGRRGMKELKA